MMYPILCKVQYENLHRTFRAKKLWIQVAFSVVVNWIVAPLFMVGPLHELLGCALANSKYSWAWRGRFFPMKEGSEKG
jgi:ACR3 family arsenite efflux pump ArsB